RATARQIRVEQSRALLVQYAGETQPQLGMRLQDIEIVFHRELLGSKEHLFGDTDLHLEAAPSENIEDRDQRRIWRAGVVAKRQHEIESRASHHCSSQSITRLR